MATIQLSVSTDPWEFAVKVIPPGTNIEEEFLYGPIIDVEEEDYKSYLAAMEVVKSFKKRMIAKGLEKEPRKEIVPGITYP